MGSAGISVADLISEGQINRSFVFTNLNTFKSYSFSYKYYTYHYNQGYKPDKPKMVKCLQNERYVAGTRFDKTYLQAKDSKGNVYVSNISIGGDARVTNSNTASVVDVFNIVSITKAVITIKKAEEIIVYKNGKEKKQKAELGAIATNDNAKLKPWLIGGALLALISLLFVFFIKRKNLTLTPVQNLQPANT